VTALRFRPSREAPPAHDAIGEPAPPAAPAVGPRTPVASGRRLALAHFALSSFAVVLVLATIGTVVLSRVAEREALDDARAVTVALGRGAVGPEISVQALRGEPAALARLDRVIRGRVLHEPIVRVKIWTPGGRIVYSDVKALIGQRFPVDSDLRRALDEHAGRAEVSDLTGPENRFERSQGRLVEVYLPLVTADHRHVVLETYRRAGAIDAASRRLVGAFLPIVLALLLALGLAQLPLGKFLVRRVRQQEHDREQLNRRTDAALQHERLRIAADLHDGVIQDLAGTAYELQAVANRLPDDPCTEPGDDLRATLQRGAHACRDSVRALRILLFDLHPGGTRAPQLEAALEGLARPVRSRGLRVKVSVNLAAPPPPDVVELVYRGAQEALRNVDRHADARSAEVVVSQCEGAIRLEVKDDGRGMTEADLDEHLADGHMGLRLLADCVAARGGALQIESEPWAGTRLSLRVPTTPAHLAPPPG
jgi:signal transduction histidine kinase